MTRAVSGGFLARRRRIRFVCGTLIACVVGIATIADTGEARPAGAAADFAIESHRDGNGEVYGGSQFRNLTRHPAEDTDPSWEPPRGECAEGGPEQRIAFASDRTGRQDIFVLDPSAGDPPPATNLTNTPTVNETAPAWAPGPFNRFRPAGAPRIAFVGDVNGDRDIFIMDADGGARFNLTRDPADDADPDWSPDGRYIAFESTRSGERQIWVLDVLAALAGTEQPTMITGGDGPKSHPTWMSYPPPSPQHVRSDMIVYSVLYQGVSYLDIAIDERSASQSSRRPFGAETTRLAPLTGAPGGQTKPAWNAYGDGLFYRVDRAGATGVRSIFTDDQGFLSEGSAVTPLLSTDTNPDPRSAPAMCAGFSPVPPRPAPVTRPPKPGGRGGGSDGGGSGSGSSGSGGGPGGGRAGGGAAGAQRRCTRRGTSRNDVLRGTARKDVLCGGRGNDRILGLGGNDLLYGGPGNDRLDGGRGRDEIHGEAGSDRVTANDRQRDSIDGGAGRDTATSDRIDRVRGVERRR